MSVIKQAVVIGAGVMGASIAAQLANADIPTLLLDIIPDDLLEKQNKLRSQLDTDSRNRLANKAKKNLINQKPSPIVSLQKLSLIETGNIEDDLSKISKADWIIEAITEDIEAKRSLLQKIDDFRKKGSIVSSNTSGISIETMMKNCSEDLQAHFLGTHFFNPPRYITLLELIATPKTNPAALQKFKEFAEKQLGKNVILTKDTPNFIANRIGAYAFLTIVKVMTKSKLSIPKVDELTGKLIGRSKSGTFQTLDLVGLDTFSYVVKNIRERSSDQREKDFYIMPSFMEEMIQHNMLGRKTGNGFYRKTKKGIEALDYQTMQYKRVEKKKLPEKELQKFIYEDSRDAKFLWESIMPFLLYSAALLGEIADTIYEIDEAVKLGFNWEKGPFEIWDSIGLVKSITKLKSETIEVPNWITEMIENGEHVFYKKEEEALTYYNKGTYEPVQKDAYQIDVQEKKRQNGIIARNNSGTLFDIGDGVAMLELHAKHNVIGMDAIEMLEEAVREVEQNSSFKGLVIGSGGMNFSVGANLALLLMEAQSEDYLEIELVVQKFQEAMMKIKYAKKPIVSAPFGNTLGGGAEICLASSYVQALQETYIGLVETGVGLIPGGGGTKELYINSLKEVDLLQEEALIKTVREVFFTVFTSKVATSAEEGKEWKLLNKKDQITMNKRYLIYDAKQMVLKHSALYNPPEKSKVVVAGKLGYDLLKRELSKLAIAGRISSYEQIIGEKLAFVLTGGNLPFKSEVEEAYLLQLERSAFMELIQDKETQKRMLHLLQLGKIYQEKKKDTSPAD
ncbi:3-hydroxyacyl-CoA dehydrogenase/enoyl-CoA hydratase family protein [Niallia sp. NCCP-28]|uniref:3-hydroxyacyl-CoA dehydrogenase/enoyl-CoA hydratase family protein n=1 Tax=Niallia sp. NCCP-28 TaxID=2934712 RepID=UPI00208052DE|nr:3-hydroxyacyl-CoA dehydrogenase/enoyl-CoA hydratase family protein [Niallia sp. NCCP-28]GKU83222.1 enoyl-CoA hydratase [Niallia sp. NCCP-28]